ncbi:MAG: nucleotide exchange factor GrpE [Polyangia bacterium]
MAPNPTDADQPEHAEPEHQDGGEQKHEKDEKSETPELRIASLEAEKREVHDRFLRLAAEFENWKKRARREQDEAATRGREALLKELLPALDNLERALQAAPEKDPVAVGVRLVDKQVMSALEKFEVKRFSALGQPFDPNMHEAIQQVESSDVAAGSVAKEFAPGYTVSGRLLRAAMVGVAKAPAAPKGDEG